MHTDLHFQIMKLLLLSFLVIGFFASEAWLLILPGRKTKNASISKIDKKLCSERKQHCSP